MTNGRADILEQNTEVYNSKDANRCYENLTELAASQFIWDKVAEAHQQVECDQGDDLIECLNVSVESGPHRFGPVQENDDEYGGHQLYGNLAPEEFDPEDAD